MTSFWSIWISVLTLGFIALNWWLLNANRKGTRNASGETPTTGHNYDGIEEYDNPLPRWWFVMYVVFILFALCYLLLYPGLGNFKGLLGWTQESAWQEEMQSAEENYGPIFAAYAQQSIEELQNNRKALLSGQRIFANNCALCHGSAARGSYGFPNLTDDDWLYGGTPETIKQSITQGRTGVMVPWGGTLGEQGVIATAEYVMSLSGREVDAQLAAAGKTQFDTYCVACHGTDGKGIQALGAPNLTDNTWLYGGSPELIKHTIRNGRNGSMPAHQQILGDDKIHLVTAYVYSLSRSGN